MKNTLPAILATLLLTVSLAGAHTYGVSSHSAGRGTVYNTSRGGSAYVGPRGGAAQTANGRTAVNGRYGAAYSGPNVTAVNGRHGGAYVGPNGGAAYGHSGGAYVRGGSYSAGYIHTLPAGYRPVTYGGYSCFYAGGIYYRPVMYSGATVYVVVP